MVYQALELLEAGIAPDEIIRDYYPSLKKESIQAALHYASLLLRDREFVPRS